MLKNLLTSEFQEKNLKKGEDGLLEYKEGKTTYSLSHYEGEDCLAVIGQHPKKYEDFSDMVADANEIVKKCGLKEQTTDPFIVQNATINGVEGFEVEYRYTIDGVPFLGNRTITAGSSADADSKSLQTSYISVVFVNKRLDSVSIGDIPTVGKSRGEFKESDFIDREKLEDIISNSPKRDGQDEIERISMSYLVTKDKDHSLIPAYEVFYKADPKDPYAPIPPTRYIGAVDGRLYN